MKKNLTMTLLGALAFMAGCTSQPEGVPVTLNVAEKGASVSDHLYCRLGNLCPDGKGKHQIPLKLRQSTVYGKRW